MFKIFLIFIFSFSVFLNSFALDKSAKWCSLKSNTVNVRTGPGKRYPIKWVYKRARMPMKVIAIYDSWIKVEDIEGAQGWLHPTMVSGRKSFIVSDKEVFLNKNANKESRHIAKLEKGVIGFVDECFKDVCKIDVDGWEGFVPQSSIWGNK
ncbi:MAG: SH3 domain-containing protein [Alphaproteobacteria bacterium]|jgi:SH3-like domain-containing protein|nr:SH3 domain-containing protein [Alphaproteobacteria bacterium]